MKQADAERILEYAKENGGATFDQDGNIYTMDRGYIVATENLRRCYNDKCSIATIIDLHIPSLYGVWYDEGVLHIDVVAWVPSPSLAFAIGRHNSERAVWDCEERDILVIGY